MLHLVDYFLQSGHSIIVPGIYNLAISFSSTVLTVGETHHMWVNRPVAEQHGVPQIPPSSVAPRNSASQFTEPADRSGHLKTFPVMYFERYEFSKK